MQDIAREQLSSGDDALPGPHSIGDWIAAFRHKEGLSLDMLAEKLGVTRQAVWYWESGRRMPRRSTLAKLNALGLRAGSDLDAMADFSMVVRMAKEKLAEDLGIDSDDIRIVIES